MTKEMNRTLGVGRSPNSFGIFKDQEIDWIFKRILEPINEKAAEIGDCLYAARLLDETDGESWIKTWEDLGIRVERGNTALLLSIHDILKSGPKASKPSKNPVHYSTRRFNILKFLIRINLCRDISGVQMILI